MRRVIDPRTERVSVSLTKTEKQQLQAIAKEKGWALPLLAYQILKAWLEQNAPAREEDEDA